MWAKALRSSLKHLKVIKSSCLISISSITKSARCHVFLLTALFSLLETCVCATLITFSDRAITGNIQTMKIYITILPLWMYICISQPHWRHSRHVLPRGLQEGIKRCTEFSNKTIFKLSCQFAVSLGDYHQNNYANCLINALCSSSKEGFLHIISPQVQSCRYAEQMALTVEAAFKCTKESRVRRRPCNCVIKARLSKSKALYICYEKAIGSLPRALQILIGHQCQVLRRYLMWFNVFTFF